MELQQIVISFLLESMLLQTLCPYGQFNISETALKCIETIRAIKELQIISCGPKLTFPPFYLVAMNEVDVLKD